MQEMQEVKFTKTPLLEKVTLLLVIIGGINWLVVAYKGSEVKDLISLIIKHLPVSSLGSSGPAPLKKHMKLAKVQQLVYFFVGISSLYQLTKLASKK